MFNKNRDPYRANRHQTIMGKTLSCSLCGGEYDIEAGGRHVFIGGVEICICTWCVSPIMEIFKDDILAEHKDEIVCENCNSNQSSGAPLNQEVDHHLRLHVH